CGCGRFPGGGAAGCAAEAVRDLQWCHARRSRPSRKDVVMFVAGKLSGIQRFLFATSEVGGGQAKRLRARSFIISLLAEIAALRLLRALAWPTDGAHYVLHGAGKFLLSGDTEHDATDVLGGERGYICDWLAQHANGELQFALASGSSPGGN